MIGSHALAPRARVASAAIPWLAISTSLVGIACAPEPARHAGGFRATPSADWPERDERPGASARGLAVRRGEVAILEGDDTLVSGLGGALGLRFDAERNDLGRVMGRYVSDFGDAGGTLVLFTTFDDRGAAGPAYFVPIRNEVEGTGLGPVDQRADFETGAFEGLANLKRLDSHPPGLLVRRLAHELAHRHLAHLSARVASSTTALEILGRQDAHWHAALHTSGSLMGGYEWLEATPGRFVVTDVYARFSDLDLYGLGLLAPSEVAPFFFIGGVTTEAGFAIPPAAELAVGARALGARIDLTIDDVVRATGERRPAAPGAPASMHVVFALLTEPGLAASSSVAVELADRIDRLRLDAEGAWRELTRGRGALCTTVEGCASEPPPDAGADATPDAGDAAEDDSGCACASASGASRPRAVELALLAACLLRGARRRGGRGRPFRFVGARAARAWPGAR